MQFLRSHIVRVALLVALGQFAANVLPPIAMCCMQLASASTDEEVVCNCRHGGNAVCPMHQGNKKPAPPTGRDDGTPQWCAGHHGSDHAAITTARVDPGRIEPVTQLRRPEGYAVTAAAPLSHISDINRPPATPPPRA